MHPGALEGKSAAEEEARTRARREVVPGNIFASAAARHALTPTVRFVSGRGSCKRAAARQANRVASPPTGSGGSLVQGSSRSWNQLVFAEGRVECENRRSLPTQTSHPTVTHLLARSLETSTCMPSRLGTPGSPPPRLLPGTVPEHRQFVSPGGPVSIGRGAFDSKQPTKVGKNARPRAPA